MLNKVFIFLVVNCIIEIKYVEKRLIWNNVIGLIIG